MSNLYTFNKEHLKEIVFKSWETTKNDFQACHDDIDLSSFDMEENEHVARLINTIVLKGYTDHVFYTLLTLKFYSL